MADLHAAVSGWKPEPVETTDRIAPWPVAAFSALLDLPGPVAEEGDPLPSLWHWFFFLDHPMRSELGDDGHPVSGHFLPPIPDRRRMFAGGRLHVREPLLVGEQITRRSELLDVRVKNGRSGEMAFVTVRHSFLRGSTVLMTEEQDVVYRSQAAGEQRATPHEADGRANVDAHGWTVELPTDPALLFRFSALTYNSHRIHYDEPYATGVEGYPGLVVHGPLLALLLLEIPRRHQPARPVTGFEFRLLRPAFCGSTIVAGGSRTDGLSLTLAAAATGSGPSITGRAELA